jgi:hypothetical protein
MYIILADLLPPVGYGLCIGITNLISTLIIFAGPGLIQPPLTFSGLILILLIFVTFLFTSNIFILNKYLVFTILLPDTTGLNF